MGFAEAAVFTRLMRTGVIEVTSANDEIKGVETFSCSETSGFAAGADGTDGTDGVELCEVAED